MNHQYIEAEQSIDDRDDAPEDVTDKIGIGNRYRTTSYPTTGTNETPTRTASNDQRPSADGLSLADGESVIASHESARTGPWR